MQALEHIRLSLGGAMLGLSIWHIGWAAVFSERAGPSELIGAGFGFAIAYWQLRRLSLAAESEGGQR